MIGESMSLGKVLVVDDDDGIREYLRDLLTGADYEVIEADDGDRALRLFETEGPDIIMLDLRMPRVDGAEVLKKVRATRPEVPVIVMTGYVDVEVAMEVMKEGAFEYLIKPAKSLVILDTVDRARRQVMGRVETAPADVRPGPEYRPDKIEAATRTAEDALKRTRDLLSSLKKPESD